MEMLILIIWFLSAIGIFLGLIATAYVAYVRGDKPLDIAAKLVLGLIVYGLFTVGMATVLGFVVFIGAHTEPVGNALDTKERIIVVLMVVLYSVVGWLMCSLINRGLIIPFRG